MQIGMSIGPYRLVERVGRGMGEVFRAERTMGDGPSAVALKVFRGQGRSAQGAGLILWHRELEALCALSHPNVVRLVDFGESGGLLYLATEYVEGMTLSEYRRARRPGLVELVGLFRQIVLGLSHAHRHGVVHLDLKPDNIVVSGSPPLARILDFGLARFAAELSAGRTALSGTFRYMAPEVLREGRRKIGPRADLYSLGVVLFEALTGCAPYDSTDPGDLVRCKLAGAVRPLGRLLPGVPAALERIVSQLLSVEPARRHADPDSVATELQDCLDSLTRDGWAARGADRELLRPRKSPLEAQFVGRQKELAALRASFDACLTGKGQVVLVSGEQGIGKSRLASEFGQIVMAGGGLFLCGRGTLMTRSTPYYPLLSAATEYLATGVASGGTESGSWTEVRTKLGQLVDHLRGAGEGEALELEIDRSRERFFNLLASSLAGLASATAPLVLVMDDFHWADPASIEFLDRLAQRIDRLAMLVVCLYRKELVERLSRLGRMAGELKGAMSLLELEPLGADEVAELVLDSAGFNPEENSGVSLFLSEQGRGNPLASMSLAFRLLEGQVVSLGEQGVRVDAERLGRIGPVAAGDPQEGPATADGVLNSLDPETRRLVDWACVIGDRFDAESLSSLMGEVASSLGALIERACAAGVLRPQGEGRYLFAHDAFRERAYGLLGAEVRKERHQRVAEMLEAASAANDPIRIPTLAEHFSRGRDLDKALHYSAAAGESSCRLHAHDSARRYLKAALLMLRARGGDSDEQRAVELRVRQALGDTFAATGEYEFADREYEKALGLCRDGVARADLIGRMALVSFKRGELETAVEGMERALGLLGVRMPRGRLPLLLSTAANAAALLVGERFSGRVGTATGDGADPVDRLRIALLNKLTFILFFFSIEKTVAAHIIALRRARSVPPCAESIEALSLHGPAMCSVPAPGRALRASADSVATGRQLGQAGALMVALFYAGVTNYFLARWEEAARCLRESAALFGRTGDVFTLVLTHENLGFTLYQQGELGLAMAQFSRGLELSVDVGDQRGETVGHAFLARIYAVQGDLNRARRHLASASGSVHALRDNSLRCGVRHSAAIVHLAAGQRSEALVCLEECQALVTENRLVQEYVAPVAYSLAEVLLGSADEFGELSSDDRKLVLGRVRRLLSAAAKMARCFPAHRGPVMRVRGLLALRSGRTAQARRLLLRSVELLKPLRMRYELKRTYQVLAEACAPGELERVGALAMSRRLALEVGCSREKVGGRLEVARSSDSVPPGPASDPPPVDGAVEGDGLAGQDSISEAEILFELVEVGRALASSLDLETLARKSLDAAVRLTRAETGLYCIVSRETGEIRVRHSIRGSEEPQAGEPDRYSRSVIENALHSGEPLLVDDALLDARFGTAESVLSHQLRSVLCLPIVAGGKPQAAIYLENNSGSNCFRPFHAEVVRMLAAQISVALENGIAFARIEENNRELESRVTARTAELARTAKDLEAKNVELVQALEELRQAQDALVQQEKLASVGRLAAGATHEINNPLNFVHGGAFAVDRKAAQVELLLGSGEPQTERIRSLVKETRELCGILINGSNRIKNVVEGLWNVAHGREPPLETIDVRRSIESTAALARSQQRPGLVVETELSDVPPIRMAPGTMDQLLLNFVLNAIDAMEGKGTVRMKCWSEPGCAVVSVADDGPGVPPELRNRIFEPFFSSKPPGKGAGLGLAICLGIVTRRGGTIRLESEPGKGATFTVRIPVEIPDPGTVLRYLWTEQG